MDESSRYLYVVNFASRNISAFIIETSGALTPITGSPFGNANNLLLETLAIDPLGRYLYTSGSGSVTGYAIDSTTGALIQLAGLQIVIAGFQPNQMTVDHSGQFLYVTGKTTAEVRVLSIDAASGALTEIADSPFAAGTSPGFIVTTR